VIKLTQIRYKKIIALHAKPLNLNLYNNKHTYPKELPIIRPECPKHHKCTLKKKLFNNVKEKSPYTLQIFTLSIPSSKQKLSLIKSLTILRQHEGFPIGWQLN
jgi:hypothetical protein